MQLNKSALSLLLIAVLVASVFGATPRPARAAGLPIIVITTSLDDNSNTPTSPCTLRKAIMAINDGTKFYNCNIDSYTNTIVLPNGPVTLSVHNEFSGLKINDLPANGDLDIKKSVNIMGSGPLSRVVWSDDVANKGRTEDRIFHIYSGATVTMENFTIAMGTAQMEDPRYPDGGGILNDGGTLTLINMTLRDNSAPEAGGGLASKPGSKLFVSNSTFKNNAPGFSGGGGIWNEGDAKIDTSLFDGNGYSVTGDSYQGAGFFNGPLAPNLVVISNSTFTNHAGSAVENSGKLALTYVTIYNNNVNSTNPNVSSGLYLNSNSWTLLRGSILAMSSNEPGKDCYLVNNSAKYVDGGYNLLYYTPDGTDTHVCPFAATTHTTDDPALSTDLVAVDPLMRPVYTFAADTPVQKYGVPASKGFCAFPALPGNANVPAGVVIPNQPGYDQLERSRPTGDKCDIGAFELGAKRQEGVYMPGIYKNH